MEEAGQTVIVIRRLEAVDRIERSGLLMEEARLRLGDRGSRIAGLEGRRNLRRGFERGRRRFGRDLMLRLLREGFRHRLRAVVSFLGAGLLPVLLAQRDCRPLEQSWRLLGFVG